MRLPNGSATYHCGIPGTSSVRVTGWPTASRAAQRPSSPVYREGRVGLLRRAEVLLDAQVDA